MNNDSNNKMWYPPFCFNIGANKIYKILWLVLPSECDDSMLLHLRPEKDKVVMGNFTLTFDEQVRLFYFLDSAFQTLKRFNVSSVLDYSLKTCVFTRNNSGKKKSIYFNSPSVDSKSRVRIPIYYTYGASDHEGTNGAEPLGSPNNESRFIVNYSIADITITRLIVARCVSLNLQVPIEVFLSEYSNLLLF